MLKPQKKKIDKKTLKKDPLLDSVIKAQTFYEEYKNKLAYAGIGLIVLVLLVVWIKALNKETEQEAMTLLGKAQVEYENMNYSKSRDFLDNLHANYAGTDSEIQGTFLLANLNFTQGNYTQAKDLYSEFIDSYSGSEILLASGYAGLAACEEVENNNSSAAENYVNAFDIIEDFPQASEYLYLAGINFLKANDSNKAQEVFNKIITFFPESPRRYDAEAKLILSSVK